MKIALNFLRFLLPVLLVFLSGTSQAFVHAAPKSQPSSISIQQFSESSNADMERLLGKKLSWKERIAYSLLKKKLKKEIRQNPAFGEVPLGDYLSAPCSKIRTYNGEIIEAEIVKITELKVIYRKCGRSSSPEIEIYKSDVFSIEAADGKVIYQDKGSAETNYDNASPGPLKNDPMAVWALISSIVGLVFFPLMILGGILGAISLGRIRRNPGKYKGRGMAMAAMIIGFVVIALVLIILVAFIGSFGIG